MNGLKQRARNVEDSRLYAQRTRQCGNIFPKRDATAAGALAVAGPTTFKFIIMKDDDWSAILNDHPIFTLPKAINNLIHAESSLELSTNTLPSFTNTDRHEDGPTPSGRRQVMILKNEDLIVAARWGLNVRGKRRWISNKGTGRGD